MFSNRFNVYVLKRQLHMEFWDIFVPFSIVLSSPWMLFSTQDTGLSVIGLRQSCCVDCLCYILVSHWIFFVLFALYTFDLLLPNNLNFWDILSDSIVARLRHLPCLRFILPRVGSSFFNCTCLPCLLYGFNPVCTWGNVFKYYFIFVDQDGKRACPSPCGLEFKFS